MTKKNEIELATVEGRILTIRGQRVILDADLASMYGVPTMRLNEQVKRNAKRLPADFMFRLTSEEVALLNAEGNLSQIAIGSQKHRDPRLRPYAFTEHGAVMAANVLRSERAMEMSVFVVRAFVRMRAVLSHGGGGAAIAGGLDHSILPGAFEHERRHQTSDSRRSSAPCVGRGRPSVCNPDLPSHRC